MTCPNCGRDSAGDRCPYCGRATRSGGGGRIVAVVVAVLLVLPCAAFGACCAYSGVTFDPRQSGAPFNAIFLMLTALSVAILVGLGFWVRKLWRG